MFKNKKIKKNGACPAKFQRSGGFTYVELIVVLSIFAVMTSIVMFNYGKFQKQISIKNLANDIALTIVQAQKDAISGKLLSHLIPVSPWKPSYGFYFDDRDDKSFHYFSDLDNSKDLSSRGESLGKIIITGGNKILSMGFLDKSNVVSPINNMNLTFTRPGLEATIRSEQIPDPSQISYVLITISSSDDSLKSYIRIYPSGRVQIN